MGKVVIARVDARLIHGQVMTNLSKSAGANAIFVPMMLRRMMSLQKISS